MNINQYAVYQLKDSAELAAYRSRSYQYLTEHHFQVIVQNYQQAYFTKLFTSDTPEMIRKRLEEHRPKNFRGRPFGVGDVIVINQQGEITAYFVDKDSLVVVAGFIRNSSSGILVTLDTKNLFIDGCAGTWMATEECVVESQHFFLMQHEVYKEKAPNVIVDASGKLVSAEIRKGLDEDARKKILDYLHTTSVRTLPEDKWIIAENAHAAIVTKDEYYQAQKAIRNVTPIQYKVGDDFALKGKICCGNCNRQLRHERQYGEMVFYCGYKRSAGKFSKCYGGYYREYSVNAKVARAIKTVFYALDVVNQGMQKKRSITVRCMDIEDLEKQAEAIRVEQIKLYESYADGVLRRDAYIEKKKTLSEKLAALQDSIRTEKEEQECADELDEEIRNLTKQASQKTYIGGLTKECVDAFVSMVYLYDDQTMKVEFNCEDVIRRALEKYGA